MKTPTRAKLLEELRGLPAGGRARRLQEIARGSKGASLDALLAELRGGDAFERVTALRLAVAAAQPTVLRDLLADPAVSVHLTAAAAYARAGESAAIDVAFLDSLPEDARRRLLRGIADGRADVAERLVPALAGVRPREAALLLSACGERTVRSHLPLLGPYVTGWRRLVRRHPAAVRDWVEAEFDATPPRAVWRVWRSLAIPIGHLVDVDPDAGLALTIKMAPGDSIPVGSRLGRWTRTHPREVFRLLTRPLHRPKLAREGVPGAVLREARRFDDTEIAELATIVIERPEHLAALLDRIAPSRRAAAFNVAVAKSGKTDVVWPDELLDVLPHDLRDREAGRILEWPSVHKDPERRLDLLAFRDLGAVREELEATCRTADPDQRGRAYRRLIAATARRPEAMAATLRFLKRVEAERDPVRLMVLDALSRVPSHRFRPDDTGALDSLIRAALDAQDCSTATAEAIGRLGLRLLEQGTGSLSRVALEAIVRAVRRFGAPISLSPPPGRRARAWWAIGGSIARATADRAVEALVPALTELRRGENHAVATRLAAVVDPDGDAYRRLSPFVEAALSSQDTNEARSAIDAWLRQGSTRSGRVRSLLDRDPSTIEVPSVARHVCRVRDDWLEGLFNLRRLAGRFRSGHTAWVPAGGREVRRWHPRVQAEFAARWESLAKDRSRDISARRDAVLQLARAPLPAARLRPFVESSDATLVEAALVALGRLDDGTGAEDILGTQVGGNHVHAAMPSLRARLRAMTPPARDRLLQDILDRPDAKLVARKEVAVMLGAWPSATNAARVLALGIDARAHRDLRIAAGSAARRLLPEARAWPVLESLAASEDPDAAMSILSHPPDGLARSDRGRYAALVGRVAAHRDVRARNAAFLQFPAWSIGAEALFAATAARRLVDMAPGFDWPAACAALVDTCTDGAEGETLLRAVRDLIRTPIHTEMDATPRRDQPARRRLRALVEALMALHEFYRRRLLQLLEDVAGALAKDPTLGSLETRIRVSMTLWKTPEAAGRCCALAEAAEADEPRTGQICEALRTYLSRPDVSWEAGDLPAAIDALTARGSRAACLIAITLLGAAGDRAGWSEAAAGRLRALRSHKDRHVREAALDTATAPE